MPLCKIFLDDPDQTYFPGSLVTGKVECKFSQKTTIRCIKIRCKHKEHTGWKIDDTPHFGNRKFLYTEKVLFASSAPKLGNLHMNIGVYEFPFSYTLPVDIPGTYTSELGHVCWEMKAIIDVPLHINPEDTVAFDVDSPIDFNHLPREILTPKLYYPVTKSLGSWPQNENPTLTLELPKRNWMPGDVINAKVALLSSNNIFANFFKINLIQSVIFTATAPELEGAEKSKLLLSLTHSCENETSNQSWNIPIPIPANNDIPNFTNCTLLKVKYILIVTASLIHNCSVTELAINATDIVLGHIPCVDNGETLEINDILFLPPYTEEDCLPPSYDSIPPPPPYSLEPVETNLTE